MAERTVIVSDPHDGNRAARTAELVTFLCGASFDRLILDGDTTDTDGALSYHGRRLFALLHKWTAMREIIVVPGNHDPKAGVLASVAGLKCVPFYSWHEAGRRIIVAHGHVDPVDGEPLDPYLRGYKAPTAIGNQIENDIGFYGMRPGRWLATSLHRLRRRLCDVRGSLREGALNLALRQAADWVVFGHSHFPEWIPLTSANPGYANAGSWCQAVNTYVAVESGEATLHEFKG